MDRKQKFIYISIYLILGLIVLLLTIKLLPIFKVVVGFICKLLLPFIVAAFISYLLHPIVVKLRSYNIKQNLAISMIYFVFFGGLACLIYFGFPTFVEQLEQLSNQLPEMITMYEEIIYSMYESTAFLPEIVHDKFDELIMKLEGKIESQIAQLLTKITNIFDLIIIITIIPVLVFYFLKDFASLQQIVSTKLPKKIGNKINIILKAIDKSLGGYIRGQFLICIVVITVTMIVYDLLDLKYAYVLAVFMGIMNIIPYFGPIIGTAPAVLIAMTMSWKVVIIVLCMTVVIQVLEGSFLSPYIMGKSVQLHPVAIIFILFIGAELGGIIGMVIGIPLVTIIRTVMGQLLQKSAS